MSYSDEQIQELLEEKKIPASKLIPLPKLNPRRGHSVKDIYLTGVNGSKFILKLRKSSYNPLDFSAILILTDPTSNIQFRLRRYNGNSHTHTNKIEGNRIFNKFHIHHATERYQNIKADEDGYAEESDRFGSLEAAVLCMIKDCNIEHPNNDGQMEIWDAPQNLS